MQQFKIRCSAIGHIMANSRKRDELSKTAQTYCKDWLRSVVYERSKTIKSKYLDKGNVMEDSAIDMVAEYLDIPLLVKNEESKEDDFKRGACDVQRGDMVIDVKCSWDVFTFPAFDETIPNDHYQWQLHGYMDLYQKDRAKLIYVLTDTPIHLIEREAYFYCKNNGIEYTDDVFEEFEDKMTYSDIPLERKIKVFDIERSYEKINLIHERVVECRDFLGMLKEINKL